MAEEVSCLFCDIPKDRIISQFELAYVIEWTSQGLLDTKKL